MPMIDKPDAFCRAGMSELWDKLASYVEFVELFGVSSPDDCEDADLPTNDDIEDAGCGMMCAIYQYSPISRCIIPINAESFIEADCPD